MKTTAILSSLFFAGLILFTAISSSNAVDQFARISPANAHKLIADATVAKPLVIIDVRTLKDFKKGHIEGAINLDYRSMDFTRNLQKMNKRQTYLLYCKNSGRSLKALKLMKKLGFTSVYELVGGINAWSGKGYSVVK